MGTTQAEAGAGSGVSTDKDGPPSTIALAVEGRRGSLPDDGFAASGGLRICFKDLAYHVPSNKNKKERAYLLKDVSGYIQPHQMTALMGPSGSGKTTLLDVLAGRKTAGVREGVIEFGGQQPTIQFLRRYTGYVEQFDTLIGQLTVREMIMYTAEMKRPISQSYAEKKEAVDVVIQKLALEVCQNVMIGNAMVKGISGGQAKRTNIAIALITNPRVLFLDEPTTGLDSYTSNEVMGVVKNLVKDGTTICATIHSPTSYCFSLFDNLMMLVRGHVVYFGPVSGAMEFACASCTGIKEYSEGYNEAEYLVDYVTEADRKGHGADLAKHYAESELCKRNNTDLDRYLQEKEELPDHIAKELATSSSVATPFWWGFKTLVKYRTTKNYQDGAWLGPRIGDKIMITLLMMTTYLGVGRDFSQDNIINIAGFLFFWVVLPTYGAVAYTPSLVLERSLFVRERADGLYHVATYLLAKIFDELFIGAIITAIVSVWTYYGIGIQGSWAFFWLSYYLTLSCGIGVAYFVASFAPNIDVANALVPTYGTTIVFFAGFLERLTNIPPWWKWYSYISFVRYSWGCVMINQFSSSKGDPEYIDGQSVLTYYGLDGSSKHNFLGFLALFCAFFFLCAYLCLSFIKYSNR